MLNAILNLSRVALVGVATIVFVAPLQAPSITNPYEDPAGDHDDDDIENGLDICPFASFNNLYHEDELSKYGVEVINYDELISFFHNGIDWEAAFNEHRRWLDNFAGQIANIGSLYVMVQLQAEKIATNIVGWYGAKKPAHSFEAAQIKTTFDLHRFVDQNEKFAEKLMGIARAMSFELDLRPKTPEAEKPKKPGLGRMASPVLLISSLIYEAASNRYTAAGESSKKAYQFLISEKYRNRNFGSDPIK